MNRLYRPLTAGRKRQPKREKPTNPQELRYRHQRTAAKLVPLEKVARCHWAQHGSTVDVVKSADGKSCYYRGLVTCGSAWMCPVCAAKISQVRREEIAEGIRRWEAMGNHVLLLTCTLSHQRGDTLKSTLQALKDAKKLLAQDRRGRDFVQRWGVKGAIRSLEVTHGDNGWHPHYHEILFVEGPRRDSVEEFEREYLAHWKTMVTLKSGRNVNGHGVDVQQADMSVSEYVAKFGHDRTTWGIEDEVARGIRKEGRASGSRTPLALLVDADQGDERAATLWQEYAITMKGSHQLRWSPGLRAKLGMQKAKTDEQIAEETDGSEDLVLQLDKTEWRTVRGNDCRGAMLSAALCGPLALELLCGGLEITPWRPLRLEPLEQTPGLGPQ